jgi:hypothetical protein
MDGDAGHARNRHEPSAGQERADRHRAGKAKPVQQDQADRPADGEGAVDGGADQSEGLRRPGRADDADSPRDHADADEAFAQAEKQAACDQDEEGEHGRRGEQPRERRDKRARHVQNKAALRRELGATAIRKTAGISARDDGGEKGAADAEAGPYVAEPELLGHEDRHDRQGHRDAEIAKEQNGREQHHATLRRVACRLRSHGVLQAVPRSTKAQKNALRPTRIVECVA